MPLEFMISRREISLWSSLTGVPLLFLLFFPTRMVCLFTVSLFLTFKFWWIICFWLWILSYPLLLYWSFRKADWCCPWIWFSQWLQGDFFSFKFVFFSSLFLLLVKGNKYCLLSFLLLSHTQKAAGIQYSTRVIVISRQPHNISNRSHQLL